MQQTSPILYGTGEVTRDYEVIEMAMFANPTFQAEHTKAFSELVGDVEFAYIALQTGDEPLSRREAMRRHDWDEWEKAEVAELASIERLNAIEWVPRACAAGKKIIKSKWVYKRN